MFDLPTAVREDGTKPARSSRAARTALGCLGVALAVTAAAHLAGVGWPEPGETDSRDYPTLARRNFTSACVAGGGDAEGCSCALEAIEEAFSFAEMVRMEETIMQTGHFPPDVAAVLEEAC